MSVSSAIEIERKYAVPDGTALPPLHGVDGVVSADLRPVALLEAVYLDTEERTLLAAGIVLRRRTGGHDAGWHIKLRGPIGRTELHAPIDEQRPDRVPDAFEAALRSRLRGRERTPIALLPSRHRHRAARVDRSWSLSVQEHRLGDRHRGRPLAADQAEPGPPVEQVGHRPGTLGEHREPQLPHRLRPPLDHRCPPEPRWSGDGVAGERPPRRGTAGTTPGRRACRRRG